MNRPEKLGKRPYIHPLNTYYISAEAIGGECLMSYGASHCGCNETQGASQNYGRRGNSFALIVVLFILLIIVGATFCM